MKKSTIFKAVFATFIACSTVAYITVSENQYKNINFTEFPIIQVKETNIVESNQDFTNIDYDNVSLLVEKKGSFTKEPTEYTITYIEHEIEVEEEYIEPEPTTEELLDEELSLLPEGFMDNLYDNGWVIELTDMDLSEEFDFPMRICGLTDYDTKTIYILDDPYYIHRVALHEVGHAFANECDNADLTKTFIKIYSEEQEYFEDCVSIGDGHETSDEREYFASVFQNIFLNYDETYENVPKSTEYIENLINLV